MKTLRPAIVAVIALAALAAPGLAHTSQHDELDKRIEDAVIRRDSQALLEISNGIKASTADSEDERLEHAATLISIYIQMLGFYGGDRDVVYAAMADEYDAISSIVTQAMERKLLSENPQSALEDYSSLEHFMILFGQQSFTLGNPEGGLKAYEDLLSNRQSYARLFDNETVPFFQGRGQDPIERSIYEVYRILPEEALVRKTISAVQQAKDVFADQQHYKDALVRYLDQYLDRFPTEPYAGHYMSVRMETLGRLDLDQLASVFAAITDKSDPQFIYSSLGFAHRLIRAGRYDEALVYLENIKKHGIADDRYPEMLLAFGEAYHGKKDFGEAIQYFLAVNKLTDRYGSVKYYIKDILTVDPSYANQITLEAIRDIDSFGTADDPENNLQIVDPAKVATRSATDTVDQRHDASPGSGLTETGSSPNVGHRLPRIAIYAAAGVALLLVVFITLRAARRKPQS